jgi:hypothetical protein
VAAKATNGYQTIAPRRQNIPTTLSLTTRARWRRLSNLGEFLVLSEPSRTSGPSQPDSYPVSLPNSLVSPVHSLDSRPGSTRSSFSEDPLGFLNLHSLVWAANLPLPASRSFSESPLSPASSTSEVHSSLTYPVTATLPNTPVSSDSEASSKSSRLLLILGLGILDSALAQVHVAPSPQSDTSAHSDIDEPLHEYPPESTEVSEPTETPSPLTESSVTSTTLSSESYLSSTSCTMPPAPITTEEDATALSKLPSSFDRSTPKF